MVAVAEPRGTRLFTGRRQNTTGDLEPPVFFDRQRQTATPHIDKENPRRGNVPGGGGGLGKPHPEEPGTGFVAAI